MNVILTPTFNQTARVEQDQQRNEWVSLKERQDSIIKDIALSSLKELGISLTLAGITCFFVAAPAIPTLLAGTIGIVAINIFLRSLVGYAAYEIQLMKGDPLINANDLKVAERYYEFLQYVCPMTFSILDTSTRNVLIHEAGHAFAAIHLYQNARPWIEIFPFKGGVTHYWVGSLTKMGQFFGSKCSSLIVTAAGPTAGILAATIDIGLAHGLKKKHPKLHRYLLCNAITNIAQHILYALSALWEKKPSSGHDFAKLWKVGGIHPIVAVVCMVALPLIVKTALFALDSYKLSTPDNE